MIRDSARLAALKEFGNVTLTREATQTIVGRRVARATCSI